MMKRLKKIMAMGMVCSMVFLSAMPVRAATCSYELDQTAIVCGNINVEKSTITLVTVYPGTYSAYVLGSNGAMAKGGVARYSWGNGTSYNNKLGVTPIPDEYCGALMPTQSVKNMGNQTVSIAIYQKSTFKKKATATAK